MVYLFYKLKNWLSFKINVLWMFIHWRQQYQTFFSVGRSNLHVIFENLVQQGNVQYPWLNADIFIFKCSEYKTVRSITEYGLKKWGLGFMYHLSFLQFPNKLGSNAWKCLGSTMNKHWPTHKNCPKYRKFQLLLALIYIMKTTHKKEGKFEF